MVCVLLTTEQLAPVATHALLVSSCPKSGVRIPLAPDFLILLFFKDLQLVLKHNQLKASHYPHTRVGSVVFVLSVWPQGRGFKPSKGQNYFFYTQFLSFSHKTSHIYLTYQINLFS